MNFVNTRERDFGGDNRREVEKKEKYQKKKKKVKVEFLAYDGVHPISNENITCFFFLYVC